VGRSLGVPLSRVYGVATFYNFFSLKPHGEHTCVVCLGTACYVKGAGTLLGAIESSQGVRAGETTPDGKLSLVTARCIGACGLAPAVVLDGEISGKVKTEDIVARVGIWTRNDEQRSA
jgi:bidirectional [NiFe] hydrogenase diaphorase subunit